MRGKKAHTSLPVGGVLHKVAVSNWFPFITHSQLPMWLCWPLCCVVNCALPVIGHFLLEGRVGMEERTSEHKYSTFYILAFDDCNTLLLITSSKVGLWHFAHFINEAYKYQILAVNSQMKILRDKI